MVKKISILFFIALITFAAAPFYSFAATAIVSWDANTESDVAGYRVYYGASSGVYLQAKGKGLDAGNALSWTFANLAEGNTYYFATTAYDQAGNESVYSLEVSKNIPVLDTTAPTTPAGLTATAISSTQINLSWTASTDNVGVTGYKIYRDQGTGVRGQGIAISYPDTGLTASTTYSYTVSALDAAGNESGKSASVSATTKAAGAVTSVYPEHPRIFLSEIPGRSGYDRLQKLRTQAQANSPKWQNLKSYVDGLLDEGDLNGKASANALVSIVLKPIDSAIAEYYAQKAIIKLYAYMAKYPDGVKNINQTSWDLRDTASVYDWIYDYLSAAQKSEIITWAKLTADFAAFQYVNAPYYNYLYKFIEGDPLWGYASYGDNPDAQRYIDSGNARFQTSIKNMEPGPFGTMYKGGKEDGDYGLGDVLYLTDIRRPGAQPLEKMPTPIILMWRISLRIG